MGTPTTASAEHASGEQPLTEEHSTEQEEPGPTEGAGGSTAGNGGDISGTGTTAEPNDAELTALAGLDGSESTSTGAPSAGHLVGGVALPLRGPGFRFNPRREERARFGTVEMVQALVRAAAVVHEELPGGELMVNDLGYREGGPIPHHGSHQGGRDVDTLFYLLGPDDQPLPSVGAPLDPQGRGVDFKDLSDPADDVAVRMDVPRTWRFIRALIEDDRAHLQRAFVAEHLRTILLEHAREAGEPAEAIARFSDMTCQPSYPHDDHFHLRFFCTAEDIQEGCRDTAPIFPWRRAELRAAGVRPRAAGSRRVRATLTTAAEARAAAGPMHADVQAWLDRREAWLERPHPGRRYCR